MSFMLVALMTFSASVAQDFRWTDKGQVKVRRETESDPDLEEVARTLSEMTYTGAISQLAIDGKWLPTTQGTGLPSVQHYLNFKQKNIQQKF